MRYVFEMQVLQKGVWIVKNFLLTLCITLLAPVVGFFLILLGGASIGLEILERIQ